jgi:predicted HTH transcriptional regulator
VLPWPLASLTLDKINEVIANGLPESQTLELKSTLLVGSDESQKLKLLKMTSSFANTFGGDVLFGVAEEDGIAKPPVGVPASEVDQFKLKVEQIVRDNLEPSLPGSGLTFSEPLKVREDKVVLVLRIARSWLAPHRVGKQGNREFWTRNSSGKSPMTIWQLRDAFLASGPPKTG